MSVRVRERVCAKGKKSAEIAEIKMQIAAATVWIETLFNFQPLKLIISDLPAFVSSLRLGEDGSDGGGGGGGVIIKGAC